MRQSQKAALSFLIATLLFSTFSFLLFSGYFDTLENEVYSARKIAGIEARITGIATAVQEFHGEKIRELTRLVNEPAFKTVFQMNQSTDDIQARVQEWSAFLVRAPGAVRLRIFDVDLNKIHFSSLPDDIQRRFDSGIMYKNLSEVTDPERIDRSSIESGKKIYYFDEKTSRVTYSVPILQPDGQVAGYAFLTLSTGTFEHLLKDRELLRVQERLVVSDTGLAIVVENGVPVSGVLEEISGLTDGSSGVIFLVTDDNRRYVLIRSLSSTADLGFLLQESTLLLSPVLKVILLFSFFMTSFLLIFFILNVRQEPEIILAERLRKLRFYFLNELAEQTDGEEHLLRQKKISDETGRLKEKLLDGVKFRGDVDRALLETKIDTVLDALVRVPEGKRIVGREVDRVEAESNPSIDSSPEQDASESAFRASAADRETDEAVKVLEDLEEAVELEAVDPDDGLVDADDLDEVEAIEEATDAEPVEDLEELEEIEKDDPADESEMTSDSGKDEEFGDLEPVEVPDHAEKSRKSQGTSERVNRQFEESGLPAIELESIAGVGAIEIVAESEDGHFSIEVHLTENQSGSSADSPERTRAQRRQGYIAVERVGDVDELECVDDQDGEASDLEDLDDVEDTIRTTLQVNEQRTAAAEIEELPGVEDESIAELEPIDETEGFRSESLFWPKDRRGSAKSGPAAHGRSMKPGVPSLARLMEENQVCSIPAEELKDRTIVFSNGTFQVNRNQTERFPVLRDQELLALIRDVGIEQKTAPEEIVSGGTGAYPYSDESPAVWDADAVCEVLEAVACVRVSFLEADGAMKILDSAGSVVAEALDSRGALKTRKALDTDAVWFGAYPAEGIAELSFIEFFPGTQVYSFCFLPTDPAKHEYAVCFFSSIDMTEGMALGYYNKLRK